MEWNPYKWKSYWSALALSIALLAVILPVSGAVGHYLYQKHINASECLTQTLDQHWAYRSEHKSGTDLQLALAEAEAIARIHLIRVGKGLEKSCAEGPIWSVLWNTQHVILGSKVDAKRSEYLRPIAWWATWNWYSYPWPERFHCAIDYSATWARVSRAKAVWYTTAGYVGRVAIYCDSRAAQKK